MNKTQDDFQAQTLFDEQGEEKNTKKKTKNKKKFHALGDLLDKYQVEDKGGYITQEFQDFGYRMAVELHDLKHKSLYIKMAKTIDRSILEQALSFVSDAESARSKAKLFMWKVKQIQESRKQKSK